MSSKTKKSHKARSHSTGAGQAVQSTEYSGSVLRPLASKDDTTTAVLGLYGSTVLASSSGGFWMCFCFRAASSGTIPASTSGSWTVSAPDATSFNQWAKEFASFRVLGVHVTVNPYLTDSTSGFGSENLMSLIVRDNNYPTLLTMFDSPTLEVHPLGSHKNTFTREMKMQGVDEAEWVEVGNAYTAISPQPRLCIWYPDSADERSVNFLVRWRVQFRSRL